MSPKRVLVVEYKEFNRHLLTDYLTASGHEVIGLSEGGPDGSAYFPYLTHFRPHLIVLSLGLPNNNGYLFLEQTKQKPEFKHIRIIVISANAPQVAEVWAIGLGASRYLNTPTDFFHLLKSIEDVLGEAESGV